MHFYYKSRDHRTKIHAVRWIPEGEIKGILQIAHGMVEHIGRYEEFAQYLAGQGILVTGNDHLGHGDSIKTDADYGYFADYNGNAILVQDMRQLWKMTTLKYPDLPYYLLGHSMGSFYARQYLCRYGKDLNGAIIMGTGDQSILTVKAGIFLTSIMARIYGWHHRSRLVDGLAFGGYNKRLKSTRTHRDWLTKEESYVDAYIRDKRCQFMFTLNAYYHMFTGLLYLSDINHLVKMPKDLPVLFVAGEEDPVGDFGEGVKRVVKRFEEVGMQDVTCKLYPDDRHEILNETDRESVYIDLYKWLSKSIKGS